MWAIIVGFFSPIVLSVIQQPKWSERVQSIVAFVYSLIAGAITAYFSGAFDSVANAVTAILLVLVATIAFYKGFWKPTGVSPAIEGATSRTAADPH